MDSRLISKYGNPKTVRYFVKSLDDLLDVVETLYKHISQKATGADMIKLLRAIRCTAVPIPRTLSSHIFCFDIPSRLLESEGRQAIVHRQQPVLNPDKELLPRIIHQANFTELAMEIRCLFDLVVFHRFFKTLMNQNSDGIKMFTTKRSAEITTAAFADENDGFQMNVSFPGTFFKGCPIPVI